MTANDRFSENMNTKSDKCNACVLLCTFLAMATGEGGGEGVGVCMGQP